VEAQRVDSRWNRNWVDHGHGRNWSSAEHWSIGISSDSSAGDARRAWETLEEHAGNWHRRQTSLCARGLARSAWEAVTRSHGWQRVLGRGALTMPRSTRSRVGCTQRARTAAEIACNCVNAKVAYLHAVASESPFSHDANLKRGVPERTSHRSHRFAPPRPSLLGGMTRWCLGSGRACWVPRAWRRWGAVGLVDAEQKLPSQPTPLPCLCLSKEQRRPLRAGSARICVPVSYAMAYEGPSSWPPSSLLAALVRRLHSSSHTMHRQPNREFSQRTVTEHLARLSLEHPRSLPTSWLSSTQAAEQGLQCTSTTPMSSGCATRTFPSGVPFCTWTGTWDKRGHSQAGVSCSSLETPGLLASPPSGLVPHLMQHSWVGPHYVSSPERRPHSHVWSQLSPRQEGLDCSTRLNSPPCGVTGRRYSPSVGDATDEIAIRPELEIKPSIKLSTETNNLSGDSHRQPGTGDPPCAAE